MCMSSSRDTFGTRWKPSWMLSLIALHGWTWWNTLRGCGNMSFITALRMSFVERSTTAWCDGDKRERRARAASESDGAAAASCKRKVHTSVVSRSISSLTQT